MLRRTKAIGVLDRVHRGIGPMLYALVISVCLIADPDNCRTYEQPVIELSANPSTAFVQAQALVAKWMDAHPGFKLVRWRLKPGRGA